MQIITINQLFQCPGLIHLSYKIISYIDTQFIQSLLQFQTSQSNILKNLNTSNQQTQNIPNSLNLHNFTYFIPLIKLEYYVKNYLNKVDRAMYYNFYQNTQFIQKEKLFIQYIVTNQVIKLTQIQFIPSTGKQYIKIQNIHPNHHLSLASFIDNFQAILKKLSPEIQLLQDEVEEIKRIFLDPCLPLPKMKRQNQGIYCNSPFQLFLVNLRFGRNNENFDDYSPFENIRQNLIQKQQFLLRLFDKIQQNKYLEASTYKNVHFARYTAYQITIENYQQLMIQDNFLHNFIVYIFALTDIHINSIMKYIQLIQDPIHKFVQLMCRYSIFRSFIIEIQENLGFLFTIYQTLYSDSIRDSVSNKPKFCFWRPAMSKWYIKMNNIHPQTNQIYCMLLTEMRQHNMFKVLQNHNYSILKDSEIIIKNKLQMNDFLQNFKNQIQRNNSISDKTHNNQIKLASRHPNSSLINDFFKQNFQLLELLTCEYVQYMVDLSIDQFQVHWCGHSEQSLDKTYFDFQNDFLQYNKNYNEALLKCLGLKSKQSQNSKLVTKLFNIIIQQDLIFLQEKNVKPVTLKILIQQINKQYFTQNPQDLSNLSVHSEILNSQSRVQQQQSRSNLIIFDFSFKDENLKYFNEKAKIIRLLDQDDKCYFSIPPLLSVKEIMIKSIDTKYSQYSDNSQENFENLKEQKNKNIFQYIFEQDDQPQKRKNKIKQKFFEKSSLDEIDQTNSIVILKKTQSLQNLQQIDERFFEQQIFQSKQSFLISSNSTKNSSTECQQLSKLQVQQKSSFSENIKYQKESDKLDRLSQII